MCIPDGAEAPEVESALGSGGDSEFVPLGSPGYRENSTIIKSPDLQSCVGTVSPTWGLRTMGLFLLNIKGPEQNPPWALQGHPAPDT